MCQSFMILSAHRPIKTLYSILQDLRPRDVVRINFPGLIHPGGRNGETHFFLVGDCFNRFRLGKATGGVVIDTWNEVVSTGGFPDELPGDNAEYFKSLTTKSFFTREQSNMLDALVYSLWSVGFIERMIRILRERFKKWAHDRYYVDLREWP
ncbi:hypothetical protein GQ607_013066 [Colletotrichum asianum]|uniref:Uncharacterized protein n=1 Tax=Colletotrichum asianum TaxID=702518 RepID=A0A8H3W5T0_9PEZI|nr:hypothetical protein GQ607_013066 [Colletotrichum asianum]